MKKTQVAPAGSLWTFDARIIWPSSARPSICDDQAYHIRHVEVGEVFVLLRFDDPLWARVICNRTLGYVKRDELKACKRLV